MAENPPSSGGIAQENWYDDGVLKRHLEHAVALGLTDNPVVMLVGPRQSGKSTLVQELPDREYFTLDDPALLALIQTNPGEWLDSLTGPVTIDEIQRAPELFLPLKLRVDRDRTPGRFLLTGSANVLALPKVADSLAGRMEVIDLLPLSQAEIEGASDNFVDWVFGAEPLHSASWEAEDIISRVMKGGFPQPVLARTDERRRAWADSYVRTLLDRDIRDLAKIESARHFPQIFRLLAARNGSQLNNDRMSRELGMSASTLRRYLDLLAKLFLIQYVPAYSTNAGVRTVRAPKAYLVDPLLVGHTLNLSTTAVNEDPNLLGPMLEGFVANELARLSTASNRKPQLFHLRTVRNQEVDFVLETGDGKLVGIEVKSSRNVAPGDFTGLRFLEELAEDRFHRGIVLYRGNRVFTVSPKIAAVPMQALWDLGPLKR